MPELILLIDDSQIVLKSIQSCLGRQFNFVLVGNAAQAEAAMKSASFSVILTDFRMPGQNGLSVLELARKLQPTAVRLVLSGYADILEMPDLLAELGVAQILVKPCSPAQLSAALKSALRTYESAAAQASIAG